uniref:NADH-ubiquinone oxidoreductase chain 5 n=1 Tax=Stenopus hispidus TaxID=6815 RepID=I6N113_STEHS|nr:NADH dehydrogenase subunit 5 [Stenopus hispidus]AEO18307.1 NADH dehydrogenase subunit 5 [Stenopus hispidus]
MWNMKMYYVSLIFLLSISISSLISSIIFIEMNNSIFLEWSLVSSNSCCINMTLILDWMSLMFLGFVTFISSMVLFYSGSYMAQDYNLNRFIYLVLGFVVSMGALIISPNLISILLGWDGLGLISYVLVIYYQNEKSAAAGMLTALSNRVGDVAILLSIAFLFSKGGWNFIFYNEMMIYNYLGILSFLLVLAGMTKSAQIPFSAWLPAAMAAPTPVSALVHSSTLVTAGIYLIIRVSPILSEQVTMILLLLASLTMFMAGLGANFEYDLKKIIALSTLSQLGVMMGILALGRVDLAFFHLLSHALFKALLFMCAGSVIHSVKDYQDIRFMGSLVSQMPLTTMCMNLANLSLCGTPFLAGFYSKDLILEIIFMSNINLIIFLLFVFSTGLTVCYTFRLIYYSMSGFSSLGSFSSVQDDSNVMTSPMLGLAVGAISGGAALSWLIFPFPDMICMSMFIKLLALLISILGASVGYILSLFSVSERLKSLSLYSMVVFYGSMWFLPFLSTLEMNKLILLKGNDVCKVGDQGWSEFYGGQGVYTSMMSSSLNLQFVQDNNVKLYMLSFLLVVVGVVVIYI